MSLKEAIKNLDGEIEKANIDPMKGLGSDLFIFSSTLLPLVNVDLMVFDSRGRVLLSWRDDKWAGKGWHFPGSCIRLCETLDDAVRRCAIEELSTEVEFIHAPIKTYEIIYHGNREALLNQRERIHTIAFAYACFVPDDFVIKNKNLREQDAGYLKWFDELPSDLLDVHDCYRRDWEEIKRSIGNGKME